VCCRRAAACEVSCRYNDCEKHAADRTASAPSDAVRSGHPEVLENADQRLSTPGNPAQAFVPSTCIVNKSGSNKSAEIRSRMPNIKVFSGECVL
jgi:hypothetical protein